MKKRRFLKRLSLILVFIFFLTNFNIQLNNVGIIKANATTLYYYNKYSARTAYSDNENWSYLYSVHIGGDFRTGGSAEYYFDDTNNTYSVSAILDVNSSYAYDIPKPYWYSIGNNSKYLIRGHVDYTYNSIVYEQKQSTLNFAYSAKGDLVTSNLIAIDGTYPENGLSSDGFWYVKLGIADNTPIGTPIQPVQNKIYGQLDNSIIPTITVTDSDNNNLICKYFIDTETIPHDTKTASNTASAQTVALNSFNITSLSDGAHSIRFEINDGVYTSTSTINFNVDKTPPTIGAVNIVPSLNSIDVAGSAIDSLSGLSTTPYRYTVGNNVSAWGSSTSYTQSSLTPNTIYSVKFEAIDKVGNIGNSVQNTYTLAQTPTFTTNNITSTTMDLNFTDSNPVATQYQIQCGSNYVNASGSLTSTPTWVSIPSSKVITVNGLTPGTAYSFQAKARNGAGIETALSTAASGTTSVSSPTTPTNITSTTSQSAITLNWSPVSGATSYDVEKDGAVVSNGNSTTFTHSGLNQNTSHTYRVRANNAGGSSAWSNLLNISTLSSAPGVPTNVTAVTSSSAITVSWDALSGAIGYDVEADGSAVDNGTKTTYIHSGLAASSAHTYRVRARTSGGSGSWSALMNVTTLAAAPAVPTNIVSSTTGTAISLSWNAVSGATGYDVEADGAVTDNGTKTTFTHTGLTLGTQHTYRVRSKNPGGTSSWSSPITQTVQSGLPSVPSNVVLSSTQSAITMSWNPVSGATGYDVQADGTVINNGAATSYVHSGLTPNTSHTYMVRAKNSNGNGAWSTQVAYSTLPNLPGVPNNITASTTSSAITLSWQAVSGATSYDVEADGVVKSNITATTYINSGLAPNTVHTYRVRADNAGGTSSWSSPINATTNQGVPAVPGNITGAVSSTAITVSWSPVQGADSYVIEVDGNQINNGTSTTYTQSGLTVGTTHSYRVMAKNAVGNGSFSSLVSYTTAATQLVAPTNAVGNPASTSIQYSWNSVLGATGYDVEIDGIQIDNGTKTTCTASSLTPNSTHTFRVRAKNSDGAGIWSSLLNVTTAAIDTPSNVTSVTSSSAITISWSAVTGATGYDIEVDGNVVNNGTALTYNHTGLTLNTQHTYRVRAKNGTGTSAWSPLLTKIVSSLGNVTNLISLPDTNKISLIWQPVTGATGYDVEADGVVKDGGSTGTFTQTGLTAGVQHSYRVRTKASGVTGNWSDAISIATLKAVPDVPANILPTPSNTSISLNWGAVAGATGYDVEVDGTVFDNGNSNTYLSNGLSQNSQHSYRVRAKNDTGNSSWSSYVTSKTCSYVYALPLSANTNVNISLAAYNITNFSGHTFTLTYNANDVDILDLCGLTPASDLSIAAVTGTDLTVIQFTPGKIVFTSSKAVANGQTWSGIINSIKLKAKINGQTLVYYNIQ